MSTNAKVMEKNRTDLETHETAHTENTGFKTKAEALGVSEIPSIPKIFVGKSVLVTGATGFLGKVLVEKLLRSCPGIKELFILIRPSDKDDAESRLKDYRTNRVFYPLKVEAPDTLNKLRALPGDVAVDNIGLSGWHLQKVKTEVSFIFHCAANVRFDDEARNTLTANLVGVQNILNVCHECQKLEALVHVSTAFAFCNQKVISEMTYPENIIPQNIIEATTWMNNDQLRALCMHHLQGRPSLYHFSKALAELLIVDSVNKVPAIIVRPSIVTAAVKEPYPGWIDNYNGPSGFIHVCGKGLVRTLLVDPTVNADWVPVDIVANTLIVAAHHIAVKNTYGKPPVNLRTPDDVPIVNCTCPDSNVITWMKVVDLCLPFLRQYPSKEVYAYPGGTVTSSKFIYCMCRLFYHYVPAFIIDLVSCLLIKKPCLIRIYCRIHRVMNHLQYYTTRSFTFTSQNMRKLVKHMGPDDKKVFPIDQSKLNWNKYVENYVLGVRRYFQNEYDDTLPDARKRLTRLHLKWRTLQICSLCGLLMFANYLYKHTHYGNNLLTYVSLFAMVTPNVQAKQRSQLKNQ